MHAAVVITSPTVLLLLNSHLVCACVERTMNTMYRVSIAIGLELRIIILHNIFQSNSLFYL
jgi:hypothetical protein